MFGQRLDLGRFLRQGPVEQPTGVIGVVLRVAAAGHVEQDPALTFLGKTRVGEREAQLGLADAGGSGDDGQRSGQQSASQQVIKGGEACRES